MSNGVTDCRCHGHRVARTQSPGVRAHRACGQVYACGRCAGVYTLTVSAAGYESAVTPDSVVTAGSAVTTDTTLIAVSWTTNTLQTIGGVATRQQCRLRRKRALLWAKPREPDSARGQHSQTVPHSEMYELEPVRLKVIRRRRPKLDRASCDTIAQAPAPTRPIERGMAEPGLLADTLSTGANIRAPGCRFGPHLAGTVGSQR